MSTPSNDTHEFPKESTPAAPLSETRPLYWSVRRELWENRSIIIAPLIVTAFVLLGTFLATVHAGMAEESGRAAATGSRPAAVKPIDTAPAPIMMTTILVGFFYCLDALYGERRDRSILFWKSLPVSDATTVFSKALIPLAVLPLIALALSLATVVVLLPVTIAASLASGVSASTIWPFLPEPHVMLYGLTVHALWYAPIYCWFLLVSAWARQAPLLWAVLPWLAVAAVEKITFDTVSLMSMLKYRMTGAMKEGFSANLTRIEPLNFLSAPGLWVGLLMAAAFLALAIRLRRNREPVG